MSRRSKWDVPDNEPSTTIVDPQRAMQLAREEAIRIENGRSLPPSSIVPGTSLVTIHDSVTGQQQTTIVKEIEINDCKNRHILTKGATLDQINKDTDATVTVRGRYFKESEPRDNVISFDDRPLFLHIASDTHEGIFRAVQKIEEIMNSNPNTIVIPGMLIAKVLVGINPEHPDAARFNIPANIIGPKGAYVKHITHNTGGTRVQLKGRGSGFKESTNSKEADEPMYLQLSSNSQQNLDKAKQLAESLVNKVKRDFAQFVLRKDQVQIAPTPTPTPVPAPVPTYATYPTYGAPAPVPGSYGAYPMYGYTDPSYAYFYGAAQQQAQNQPTVSIAPPGTYPPPTRTSPPPKSTSPENKKRPLEDTTLEENDTKRVKLDEKAPEQQQQLDWNSMDAQTKQYYENLYANYYAYYGYGAQATTAQPAVSDAQTEEQVQELLAELEKGKKK